MSERPLSLRAVSYTHLAGSGLYGAVFAYEMKKRGKKCLVIDKRNHIGGNIYCEKIDDINAVSYTHLDVYKGQAIQQSRS